MKRTCIVNETFNEHVCLIEHEKNMYFQWSSKRTFTFIISMKEPLLFSNFTTKKACMFDFECLFWHNFFYCFFRSSFFLQK